MRSQQNTFRREITCEFYRVQIGNGNSPTLISLVDAFRNVNAIGRNRATDDGYLRFHGWEHSNGIGKGVLLHLRMAHSASIASVSQDELHDLQLGQDEALAEYSCFCYFDEFNTLVMHRNRFAGTHARMAQYVEAMSGMPVSLLPILTTDALRRLEQMREVTVAELKIALPQNLGVFDGGNASVSNLIRFAHDNGAATISAKISMAYSRRPLLLRVKDIWRDTVMGMQENTRAAKIRGRGVDGSDELITIDLLKDRIQERVELHSENSHPMISDYHSAIEWAYSRRRQEIAQQFMLDQDLR